MYHVPRKLELPGILDEMISVYETFFIIDSSFTESLESEFPSGEVFSSTYLIGKNEVGRN